MYLVAHSSALGSTFGATGAAGCSTGVSVGTLLASATPTGIHVARPQIFLNDSGLYAELQKKNVSDVSTAQSKLFIKKQVEKSTASSGGTVQVSLSDAGVSDATFAPYDGDRYSISTKTSSSTVHIPLSDSQVVFNSTFTTVTFNGVPNSTAVVINLTLEKDLINNKTKNISRSNSIVIKKSSRFIFCF